MIWIFLHVCLCSHRHTEIAIKNIHTFDAKWKIRTNTNKFQIIPLFHGPRTQIKINDTHIPSTTQGTILGLTITTNGLQTHVNKRLQTAT